MLITGKTYHIRAELRALGGRWVPEEKGWNIPDEKHSEALALLETAKQRAKAERSLKAKAAATVRVENDKRAKEQKEAHEREVREYVPGSRFIKAEHVGQYLRPVVEPGHLYAEQWARNNDAWANAFNGIKPGSVFRVCSNTMSDRGTIWLVRVNEKQEAVIIAMGDWWAMSVNSPATEDPTCPSYGKVLGIAGVVLASGTVWPIRAVDVNYFTTYTEGNG